MNCGKKRRRVSKKCKEKKCTVQNCDRIFRYKKTLTTHFRVDHQYLMTVYSCSKCCKCFNGKYNYKKHIMWHRELHRKKCPVCKKVFNRCNIKKHIQRKHGQEKIVIAIVKEIFDMVFFSNTMVDAPSKNNPTEEEFNTNSVDNRNIVVMDSPIVEVDNETVGEGVEGQIGDSVVDNGTVELDLVEEKQAEAVGLKFVCSICDYNCRDNFNLERHHTSVHSTINIKCCHWYCSEYFPTKWDMKIHSKKSRNFSGNKLTSIRITPC